MMRLFLPKELLLLASCLVSVNCAVDGQGQLICPTETEIDFKSGNKCICYPSIKYLICTNVDQVDQISFAVEHSFDSLFIKNSIKLANSLDSSELTKITLKSLDIVQDGKVETADLKNLQKLLGLPTESIKIVSKMEIPLTLDITKLSEKLQSISINQVNKLKHKFKTDSLFKNFANLKFLQFRDVNFETTLTNTIIAALPKITRIEFSGTDIAGTFKLTARSCTSGEKIYIILNRNGKLKNFDFDSLFPNNVEPANLCQYHIDLSDSSMDEEFLSKEQIATIEKHPGKIYLLMRNVKITCNCQLYKLYHHATQPFSSYIHSIFCVDFGTFLDEIDSVNDPCKDEI